MDSLRGTMAAIKEEDLDNIGSSKDRAYYEHHISQAIQDFYFSEFGAEGTDAICKCNQNSFVACCEFVRRSVINRADLLITESHAPNSGCVVHNEVYDPDKIAMLADIYINCCYLYDKIPSVLGFSKMIGVNYVTISKWIKADGLSSSNRVNKQKDAINSIKASRALSLQNVAVTGGKGTVGCIAVLNNEVWNNQNRIEDTSSRVLSLAELPDLQYIKFELEDKTRSDVLAAAGDPVGDVAGLAGLPVLGDNTEI